MAALASTAAVTGLFQKMSVNSVGTSTFLSGESVIPAAGCQSPTSLLVRRALTIEAAHKKGSGSTKNGRDSNSKRLGVKIYGDQVAQPGSIIVRQRGTRWHPGTNVGLGNDYTIYSKIDGLVKFEKYGPDRTKISVYPVLEEKVENPNSRRVQRREMFRARRDKKRQQRELDLDYVGTPLISIASSTIEEESAETVIG